MIRNIEDENKNLKRYLNSDFSGYLSEEALAKLIEQVETKEMLHAPSHLKENVLKHVRQDKRSAKNRQLFVYRAKVLVAMAAALTLLILMPEDRMESEGSISVEQQVDESLEQMAIRRQEDIDANWEKYLKERESGGVRGFLRSVNEKVTEFGTSLYNSIG